MTEFYLFISSSFARNSFLLVLFSTSCFEIFIFLFYYSLDAFSNDLFNGRLKRQEFEKDDHGP